MVFVKHVSGGTSALTLKSYESGREAFEGNEVDVVWLDEEPPLSVYFEAFTRIMSTDPAKGNGLLIATFTPMEGLTDTALLFAPGGAVKDGLNPETGRYTLNLTWDDAPHLSAEVKEEMLRAYPPYMRDARTRGVPQLGSGAIFPVPESEIVVSDFPIPDHWPRACALDVGWNYTAAVWIAIDPKSRTKYLYSCHKQGHSEPAVHARAILSRGDWIPVKVDPAARGRAQRDGRQLYQDYKDLGLNISVAANAVESGLMRVWQALSSGEFKVFRSCEAWFAEARVYRRDERGNVVKENDHLMDATRYWFNSGEDAAIVQPVKKQPNPAAPYRGTTGAGAVFSNSRR
jgi:phage terminase large subunit-like protein